MEISSNSLNQPVNFYPKNTGNSINTVIDGENNLFQTTISSSEFAVKKPEKISSRTFSKKRKSKRLNTIDTDYLPDENENIDLKDQHNDNFFILPEEKTIMSRFKTAVENFIITAPLINYCFLRQKQKKIQKTVQKLNDITQNVDELLNTAVPYGEEEKVYKDIAKNLTKAANILGKSAEN